MKKQNSKRESFWKRLTKPQLRLLRGGDGTAAAVTVPVRARAGAVWRLVRLRAILLRQAVGEINQPRHRYHDGSLSPKRP